MLLKIVDEFKKVHVRGESMLYSLSLDKHNGVILGKEDSSFWSL